jgi:hypothetical protein
MTELVLFPPPDRSVWEYLDAGLQGASYDGASLTGVHGFGTIPTPRPDRFVRVRLGGGVEVDVITTMPTVYVESYGTRTGDAKAIAEYSHALMLKASRDGWLGDVPIRSIDVISRPQELPDPLTSQARYTATYGVRLRGQTA